ncbi:phage major capsid protein [Brachybacterium sp. SGAir0954]|uniref:phage major capsid protein n=1 Tax=Brachybacterium sp. SGAir0954 TaxID=2571029 RepID=UPI0010CCE995|nr:phage major capsid protein [Brachybacterium sp. SGAir0954]QCR53213.1 phage major capsid protein [Brachybacterium sp. SGAir0954]
MAGIDLNRTSAGVASNLPREISQEIWSTAVDNSVFMQAARQINIPGTGVTIPIITGDAEADWVAETAEKPVSNATVSSKVLTPYKLAVIEPFSDEFRRDLPGLYAELARRLPLALGKKFDQTILGSTAPGSGFDVLGGSAAVAVGGADVVDDLATVLSTVAAAGGDLSHWLVSPQLEGTVMTAKDGQGNYAFLRDARTDSGAIGSIFGRDVLKTSAVFDGTATPDVTGIAGDFARSAIWGSVEGIKVGISDQATINRGGTQINLWQRNMFAIRAEVEIGFIVRDPAHFVKLTADAA